MLLFLIFATLFGVVPTHSTNVMVTLLVSLKFNGGSNQTGQRFEHHIDVVHSTPTFAAVSPTVSCTEQQNINPRIVKYRYDPNSALCYEIPLEYETRKLFPTLDMHWFIIVPNLLSTERHTNTSTSNGKIFHQQQIPADVNVSTIQFIGPVRSQMNLIFLSNGYLDVEMITFQQTAVKFAKLLSDPGNADMEATVPFRRMFPHFNVYSVFQPSAERGATDPSTNAVKNTNLKCTYGVDVQRALQCDRDLALKLASFAPSNPIQYPSNTVIVVIVNSAVYGGTGIYRPYKMASFFNGFDLDVPDEKMKMTSLMYHELGHALSNLADEYVAGETSDEESKYSNCALKSSTLPLPWAQWQKVQLPDLPSGSPYGVDDDPQPPCYYKNYVRPSSSCLMGTLNIPSLCPVCREASLLKLYQDSLSRELITWPRCPHSNETILLARSEKVTLYVPRNLVAENGFDVLWVIAGTPPRLIAQKVTTAVVEATILLEVPTPTSEYTVNCIINDTTSWVTPSRRESNMVQVASFVIRVLPNTTSKPVNANTTTKPTYTVKQCPADVELFTYDAAPQDYKAECRIPDNGCNVNFKSSHSTTVHNFADDTKKLDSVIVSATVLFFALAVTAWGMTWYYFVLSPAKDKRKLRNEMKRASPASRTFDDFFTAVKLRRCVLGIAVLGMLLCVVTIIVGAVMYEDQSVVVRVAIGGTMTFSALMYLISFMAVLGAWQNSRGILLTYVAFGVLFLLPLLAACVVIRIAQLSVNDRSSYVSTNLESEWKRAISKEPAKACAFQKNMECSGWYRNCAFVHSTLECPTDCDDYNDKYNTPCRSAVLTIAEKYLGTFFGFLLVLNMCLIIHLVLTCWLYMAIKQAKQLTQRAPPVFSFEAIAEEPKQTTRDLTVSWIQDDEIDEKSSMPFGKVRSRFLYDEDILEKALQKPDSATTASTSEGLVPLQPSSLLSPLPPAKTRDSINAVDTKISLLPPQIRNDYEWVSRTLSALRMGSNRAVPDWVRFATQTPLVFLRGALAFQNQERISRPQYTNTQPFPPNRIARRSLYDGYPLSQL